MIQFEVKNRWTGAVQFTADIDCPATALLAVKLRLAVKWAFKTGAGLRGANLTDADLTGADLRAADLTDADLTGADLRGADLTGADLRGADLTGADLRGADLTGADLTGADLRGANLTAADLTDARGINPHRVTPLLMLLDQPGPIRAYKLVNQQSRGPIHGGLKYEIGQSVAVDNANSNPAEQCGAGINVATLDWCMRQWCKGYRILLVEFTAVDIACIPTATDGKFRLHRCAVVGEVDLAKIGLLPAPTPEKAEAA